MSIHFKYDILLKEGNGAILVQILSFLTHRQKSGQNIFSSGLANNL